MAIKIETEKVVSSDGNRARKIIKINMLRRDKLPKLYLDKTPRCYATSHWGTNGFLIYTEKIERFYPENGVVFESEWQEIVKNIHACGDRLMLINNILDGLKKNWNGTETFII